MTPKQLLKGFKNYTCNISLQLANEPVLLHKHPEPHQATIVYDKFAIEQWLSAHNSECMNTRVKLIGDQKSLVSIKEEMLAFVLSAADSYEKFSKEDMEKEEIKEAYEELSKFIKTLTPELMTKGRKLLTDLENDQRVSIPMDGIGRLISFGIEADYNKQAAYEKTQPRPAQALVQVSPKPLNNNNQSSRNNNAQSDAEERELALAIENSLRELAIENSLRGEMERMERAFDSHLRNNNNISSLFSSSSMYQPNNRSSYASENLLYSFRIAQQNKIEAEMKEAAEAERRSEYRKKAAETALEAERCSEYLAGNYKMGFGEMLKMKIPEHIRKQISHFEFWHNGNQRYAWPTVTPDFFFDVETAGLNLTHLLDNPATALNIHRGSIKLINKTGGVLKECPVSLYRDPSVYRLSSASYRR